MDKVYERVASGRISEGIEPVTKYVSRKDGLAEVNSCMIGDRRKRVSRMSSISRTDYHIVYRSGEVVTLTLVDAPAETEQTAPTEPELPDAWTVASHRMLLHRFTAADETGRAVCNRRFRPWRYGNGYAFRTKPEQLAHEYADLYTFCPRCEAH